MATGAQVEAHRSLQRAFEVLELIADNDGRMGVAQLAAESRLPLSSMHRLVSTLAKLGYLHQEPSRKYVLGAPLVRLGHASSRLLLANWGQPRLARLADELGESVHLTMLDGDEVRYVAQAPSSRSMRMFTEVGRRVLPHCCAAGNAILSAMAEDEVRRLLARTGMPRYTENTITDTDTYVERLRLTAEAGYALDDAEQETGVRCVAVLVPDSAERFALSVSGPTTRMSDEVVSRVVPLLIRASWDIAAVLP
ncbi:MULTISPECIES: IclR family transcriptional regulator [unclassified Nocardioides]|uniref:IclR family transcriptional regulator n=1 Tax=unclassified Nocardioides TaxID=2615069 RepID=UPI0006FF4D76|nr:MULTISPECIES: IclR family transcriptional regulator [unclassified Nocardioides]KQY63601.1 IclR family transcriptional regulator [Nocardioides sp. Root140]KRF15618.1 IclR family transcriptional regulator [Nocardioides sp. Soil796]